MAETTGPAPSCAEGAHDEVDEPAHLLPLPAGVERPVLGKICRRCGKRGARALPPPAVLGVVEEG